MPGRAVLHDPVVVALEDGTRDGRERVHPALRRPHVPLVDRGGHARLLEEPPAARCPRARRIRRPRSGAGARPCACAPRRRGRTAASSARSAANATPTPSGPPGSISTTDSTPSPPRRPRALVVDRLPDPLALALEQPRREEAVVGHAPAAGTSCARSRRSPAAARRRVEKRTTVTVSSALISRP